MYLEQGLFFNTNIPIHSLNQEHRALSQVDSSQ